MSAAAAILDADGYPVTPELILAAYAVELHAAKRDRVQTQILDAGARQQGFRRPGIQQHSHRTSVDCRVEAELAALVMDRDLGQFLHLAGAIGPSRAAYAKQTRRA